MDATGWAIVHGAIGYALGALTVGVCWFALRKVKPKRKGLLLVGLRPSSRRARVRDIDPVRGIYTWSEKDFEADIPMDAAMHYDAGEHGSLVLVDLDSYHPVRFEGSAMDKLGRVVVVRDGKEVQVANPIQYDGTCLNDSGTVEVARPDGSRLVVAGGPDVEVRGKDGVLRVVRDVWLRLPGTRLAKVRKDTRLDQMNATVSSWWMALTRFVPIALIMVGIISLITLGLVIKGVVWK